MPPVPLGVGVFWDQRHLGKGTRGLKSEVLAELFFPKAPKRLLPSPVLEAPDNIVPATQMAASKPSARLLHFRWERDA